LAREVGRTRKDRGWRHSNKKSRDETNLRDRCQDETTRGEPPSGLFQCEKCVVNKRGGLKIIRCFQEPPSGGISNTSDRS